MSIPEGARDIASILPGEGDAVWFTGNRMTYKATAETTGGSFGLVEALAPPGASPPLHVHHREDESFWILEGTLKIVCGERTFIAEPRSFALLPRDIPHTFLVLGDAPARLLSLCTPGGFERFFAAAGRPAEHDGLPPAGPPDVALLRQVGAEFGLEILGPPLSAEESTWE